MPTRLPMSGEQRERAVHVPEDTNWDRHEGAHVDPDGNVLRFGSAII